MMRMRLIFWLTFFLSFWMGISTAFAEVEVTLGAPTEVSVGDVFDVNVNVSAVVDLDTASFTLSFDDEVIRLLNMRVGTLMATSSLTYNWSDGEVRVVANHEGVSGVTGQGSIVVCQFQAFKPNSFSNIAISNLLLGNILAEPIPALPGAPIRVDVKGTPPQTVFVNLNAPTEAALDAVIDVFIETTTVNNLDAVDFTLMYTPTVLQYLSAEVGDALPQGTSLTFNIVPGKVHGVMNLPGVDGFSGEGSIVHARFLVVGLPQSQGVLAISDILLGDIFAQLIESVPGAPVDFTVSGQPPNPVTVGLLVPQAVRAGNRFTAYVDVTQVTELDVASFSVKYDKTVLRPNRVVPGNLTADAQPLANIVGDQVNIVVNKPNLVGIGGTGTLAGIEFEAIGGVGKSSTLTLINVLLGDINGRPIPVQTLAPRLVSLVQSAPPSVEVSIEAPTRVDERAFFDVNITVTQVNNLDTAFFALAFNKDILQLTQVLGAGLLADAEIVENRDIQGQVHVVLNLGGVTGVSGAGAISSIRFQAIGASGTSSSLVLAGVLLGDIAADNIPLFIAAPPIVNVGPRPENNPPVANAQSVTTDEDTSVQITLTGIDPDGDALTFNVQSQPANGSLSGTAPDLTYTPNPDFNGNDHFTFTVNDGRVDSSPATVTITVKPVNDQPVANAQSVTTDEDIPVQITLTGSDKDGDKLSFNIATQPTNGSLSGTAPNLTYTPKPDFNGSDSFTFTVNDGTVDSAPATVNITVNAVLDPPFITAGPAEGEHLTITTTTFQWIANPNEPNPENQLFSYRLDDEPYSEFASDTSHTYTNLSEGLHTFMVRAKEASSGIVSAPAIRHFGVDLTPPNTQLVAGPPDGGWVNISSVTFTWTGADNVSTAGELTFAYKFDGGEFTAFSAATSHTFNNLAEGQHTFVVKAKDKAGHEDPTPLTITFTVDMISPDTIITVGPDEGALIATRTVTLEWTGSDNQTSVAELQFAYNLDINPFSAFGSDTSHTLTGLADGLHTFNVKARDLARNEDPTVASRHFTVDATPPNTTITVGPAEGAHLNVTTVTFGWTGSDNFTNPGNLLFSYRLNSGDFCDFSPNTTATLTDLPEGHHTFEARAKDEAGNIETTAVRHFAVDLTPPETQLVAGPSDGGWGSSSVTFVWTGTDNVSTAGELLFAYKFDDGNFTAFAPDTSQTFINLREGSQHTFVVKAKDKAGHEDPTPLTIHFTVDTTPPDTTITAGPNEGALLTSRTVTFEWTGNDDKTVVGELQFAYKMDAEPFSAFSSATSHTFTELSDGAHTLSVKARDLATNEDATPATRSFEIDATPPTTTITAGPSENEHISVTTATFEWTGADNRTAESNLLFSYRLDSTDYSEFSPNKTVTLTNLSEGLHTFEVQAKDEAGNIETATIHHFGVDLTPPDTQLTYGPADGEVVKTASVTFWWTGIDNLSTWADLLFAYKFDSGDFTSFGSETSHTFDNLTEGTHTFVVKAKDKAGHEDPTPLSVHFTAAFVDLQPTAITAPYGIGEVWSGQPIQVTWTVRNNGSGTASGSWEDEVYLSADDQIGSDILLGEFEHTGGLAPGASYSNTQSVILPNGIEGNRWIVVETDSRNNVYEENAEGNNILVDDAAIHVNFTSPPDLQVTNVTPSGDAWSGRLIYVDWTVSNNGAGRASGNWEDGVYISADDQVGNDTLLGTFSYDGSLNVGESYTFSRPVTLPPGIEGNHWIIVTTDWANQVYEHDAENNNSRVSAAPIFVRMLPYPDLTVTSVTAPSQAFAGRSMSVSWTVQNSGTGATDAPFWYDSVYLSIDRTFDGSDTWLGYTLNASYLDTGENYVQTAQLTLPREIAGPFYLLVQTDSYGYVQEYNVAGNAESNNWGSSATHVQVQLPPMADLQVTQVDAPAEGRSGLQIQVTWEITNKGDAHTEGSTWSDTLYLSEDTQLSTPNDILLGTFVHEGALEANGTYMRTENVTLPVDRSGQHYIFVLTDSENHIYEQLWEGNNSAYDSEPIDITLSPPADLEITSIFAPAVASAGNSITIDWIVSNNGGGATNVGYWSDSVYLSPNETLETGSDTLLGIFSHSGALEAGANYSESRSVTLPKAIQGVYYIIVWTDSGNAVFEYEWENNNTRSTSSIQIKVANLTVSSVNAPVNGSSGSPIAIDWTISNIGDGSTDVDAWNDSVYLSANETLEPASDTLLGEFPHSGRLEVGANYVQSKAVTLTSGIEGVYYLIVWTDSTNAAFESDEDNNTRTASPPIQVRSNKADLQVLNVSPPKNAIAGQAMLIQWTVTNAGTDGTGVTSWQDGLYLSIDQLFQSGTDVLLATFPRDGALAPGSKYTRSESVTVPLGIAAGEYYVLVNADKNNDVDEFNAEANNVGNSLFTVQISSATPDLQVTNVDAPATGNAGRDISVSWTVTNTGGSPNVASNWTDDVYLSLDAQLDTLNDIRLGRFGHYGSLPANGSYNSTQSMKLPQAISGNYYVFVQTDALNNENEFAGENNNVAYDATPLQVTFTPADLQVANISVPGAGWAGQLITVNWTVENRGTGETDVSYWYDTLYFSRDTFFDSTDESLGYFFRSDSLRAGNSYTQSLEVSLPSGASGPGYIIAFTDRNNQVYEHNNENNNVRISSAINVTLTPPADLIVSQIDPPASGVPGQPSEIHWTVTNQSASDAVGRWWDSIYLSADQTWDIGDAFVSSVEHIGTLGPGLPYTGSVNTALPGVVSGNYYVIVRTDIRNQVRENNESNNVGASTNPISMDVTELALGVPYNSQLSTGAEHYYKVTVPSGEDLLITLDSASTVSANELYVRYGVMPSPVQYDFLYDEPFEPDQEITVPTTKAGDYYILVRGGYVPDAPAAYQISADTLDFRIIRVTPNYGGNIGIVTTTLSGAGFKSGATVHLTDGKGLDILAKEVLFNSSTSMVARFNLTGQPLGVYNVVVINPGGESAQLPNAFTIQQGQPPFVVADIIGPGSVRPNSTVNAIVSIRNESNTDAEMIIIMISYPDDGTSDSPKIWSPQLEHSEEWYPVETFFEEGMRVLPLIVSGLKPGESRSIPLKVESGRSILEIPITVAARAIPWESLQAGLTIIYNGIGEILLESGQLSPADAQIIANAMNKSPEELFGSKSLFAPGSGVPVALSIASILTKILAQTRPELAAILSGSRILVSLTTGDNLSKFDIFKKAGSAFIGGAGILATLGFLSQPVGWIAFGAGLLINASDFLERNPWIINWVNDLITNIREGLYRLLVVRPRDPNDKIAPAGSGAEGFVSGGQTLPYTINFENVPDATAPAEQVSIADQLDLDLDWRAFRLGEIAFGDTVITVPENRSVYQMQLTLDSGMLLDINAGIDITTGEASWLFRTIDPATGEPPVDPSLGFLPPNDENHRGEGHVTYTIKPKTGLADGTRITNKATIVFDTNEAIDTNEVTNLIHNILPDLTALSLAVQSEQPTLIEGETLTLTATAQNNSDAPADAFNVRFFDGNPDAGGQQIGSAQAIASLAANGTQTVQVEWTPTRLRGERQVYVKIDPDGAVSEVNEQNNVSISSLMLNPRSFTVNLAQDINMLSLPLEPETPLTARSFAAIFGATMLVRYNTATGQFEAFIPDFHTGNGFPIEGSKGYIAVLSEAKSVTFEGISQLGTVQVAPDINMLSLPLQPSTPYTARSFGTQLGANMLIKYNNALGQFEAFIPDFHTGNGFEIEGGKGYIAIATEGKSVTFSGKGWLDGTQPPAVPLLANTTAKSDGKTSSVLGIAGYIYRDDGKTPVSKVYTVTITNNRTNVSILTTVDAASGQYAGAFVVLFNQQPIKSGDKIEIVVKDADKNIVGGPVVYTITPDDIKNRYAKFNISLTRLIPTKDQLAQNFPNPFNPDTWIPYQLSKDANVTIKIYNVAGQLVRTLELGQQPAGYYMEKEKAAYWNGRNDIGERTASGIYFYTIKAGKFTATKKMVLLK